MQKELSNYQLPTIEANPQSFDLETQAKLENVQLKEDDSSKNNDLEQSEEAELISLKDEDPVQIKSELNIISSAKNIPIFNTDILQAGETSGNSLEVECANRSYEDVASFMEEMNINSSTDSENIVVVIENVNSEFKNCDESFCDPDQPELIQDPGMVEYEGFGQNTKNVKDKSSRDSSPERKKLRKSFTQTFSGRLSDYVNKFVNESEKDTSEAYKYFRIAMADPTLYSNVQEPWPKDVKLYQPYDVEQILLPDNANCLAVQTFLKMCGLEFKIEHRANAEAMSPTGKVPFIKCGAFVVSELDGIVQFVGSKGISLTESLSSENKAEMRAYKTLVNNVFGNAELYICWCDNETYTEITKPRYSSVYPWPLNHLQTWSKRQDEVKKLKVIGWYEKTLEEVYDTVERCCQSLTDCLEDNDFFFGNKPTELEALIFGHLYSIITTPLANANLANIVKNYPKLIDLVKRIEKTYFERESSY